MGLIRNLLNTTQDIAIGKIEQGLLLRALESLTRLPPEIPLDDVSTMKSATCDHRVDREDDPGVEFFFELELPPAEDERLLFVSIHRSDLSPVRLRLKGHNQHLDRRMVFFHRIKAGEGGGSSAEFFVPFAWMQLPAGRHQLLALVGMVGMDGSLKLLDRLSLLADLESDQTAMLEDESASLIFQGRELLSVVVGLSMFVAFADGRVDEAEEERIALVLANLEEASQEQRKALVAELRRMTAGIRFKKEYLDELCRLASEVMTSEARKVLVHILFSVAAADGELHPGEEKMLNYITNALEIPEEVIHQLQDEFFKYSRRG